LDAHGIGADAPGGSGTIKDRSLDLDYTEVHIVGVYDLSKVAEELNDHDPAQRPDHTVKALWAVIVFLVVIIGYMALR